MEKKKSKLEPGEKVGTPVPTYPEVGTSEVGTRIREVQKQIGTVENAAKIAGVDSETLNRWMKGGTKASFVGVSRLAQAAGKSLDWVATGRAGPCESAGSVDPKRLQEAVEMVEMLGKDAPAKRKARAVVLVYERLIDDQGQAGMIEWMRLIRSILEEKGGENVDS